MNNIIRAWKDEAYRQSLSAEEQAILPANPAGEIELTEAELEAISGALGGFCSRSSCSPSGNERNERNEANVSQSGFGTVSVRGVTPPSSGGSGLLTLVTSLVTGSSSAPFLNVTDNTCSNRQSATPSVWDF
jgi:mersacidin/lichenicidin family type 2 lantibiotic